MSGIGEQSRLYNGPEYNEADPAIKSNPFYNDVNIWKPATVYYDNILYKNVPVKYDVFKDQLVALHYNKVSSYVLLNDKLQYFDLSGQHFVSINVDSLDNPGIKNGIYEELYKGKTQVLVRASKTMQISTSSSLERYFTTAKKEIYLKKGDRYFSINGKSSILKALKDKQTPLRLYIKSNNLDYKKGLEQALVKIAFFYDQLKD
ncbi:hypothetical protein [Mucilaginibacter sp.]|uniref:hypothetical protein n=1 Tax=Mucilaginibacter sp. TaxID=1882438 RepID=UPI003B008D32